MLEVRRRRERRGRRGVYTLALLLLLAVATALLVTRCVGGPAARASNFSLLCLDETGGACYEVEMAADVAAAPVQALRGRTRRVGGAAAAGAAAAFGVESGASEAVAALPAPIGSSWSSAPLPFQSGPGPSVYAATTDGGPGVLPLWFPDDDDSDGSGGGRYSTGGPSGQDPPGGNPPPEAAPVPEPTSAVLFALGFLGLFRGPCPLRRPAAPRPPSTPGAGTARPA